MKIRKTDLLYRWYENFYHPDPAPTPTSICRLFWTATLGNALNFIFGLVEKCAKMNIRLTGAWFISLLVAFYGIWASIAFEITSLWYLMPVTLAALFTFLVAVVFAITELIEQLDKEPVWVQIITFIAPMMILLSLLAGVGYVAGPEKFFASIGYFLRMIGCIIAVVMALCSLLLIYNFILRPMATWRLMRMCGSMLVAIKRKVCPLVEIEEDEIISNSVKDLIQ